MLAMLRTHVPSHLQNYSLVRQPRANANIPVSGPITTCANQTSNPSSSMFLHLLALASCALALPAPYPYYYGKETYGRGKDSGSTTPGLAIGIFFACAGGAILIFTVFTLVATRCLRKKEQAEAADAQTYSGVRSPTLHYGSC